MRVYGLFCFIRFGVVENPGYRKFEVSIQFGSGPDRTNDFGGVAHRLCQMTVIDERDVALFKYVRHTLIDVEPYNGEILA